MSMLKPIQHTFHIDTYASANMAENNPKCLYENIVGYVHPMSMLKPIQNPFNIDICASANMAENMPKCLNKTLSDMYFGVTFQLKL